MVVQLFELMRKQEETRQAELVARKAEHEKELAAFQLVRYFSSYRCSLLLC